MKVAHQLGRTGRLETVRGRNGGLRLDKPPEEIVVGKVVRKMEPDFAVVECQNPAGYFRIPQRYWGPRKKVRNKGTYLYGVLPK